MTSVIVTIAAELAATFAVIPVTITEGVRSVRGNIMADINDTVDGITGLDGGAVRWSRSGTNTAIKPCAVVRWSSDRVISDGPTSHNHTRALDVEVAVFCVKGSEGSDDEAAEGWIKLVEAAVMGDRTCGGYARDTRLVESVQFPVVEGQSDIGGVIRFEVTYVEAV